MTPDQLTYETMRPRLILIRRTQPRPTHRVISRRVITLRRVLRIIEDPVVCEVREPELEPEPEPERILSASIDEDPSVVEDTSDHMVRDDVLNSSPAEEDEEWNRIIELLGADVACFCKHCGKSAQPLVKFAGGLRKKYRTGKLSPDTLPKTCDAMQETNRRMNPYNNRIYALRKQIHKFETLGEDTSRLVAELLAVERLKRELLH